MRIFKKIWGFALLVKGFVGLARDPYSSPDVKRIIRGLYYMGGFNQAVRHIRGNPENNAVMTQKFRTTIDLKELVHYRPGTIGREIADHLNKNGLDPRYFHIMEPVDDASYVMVHASETHDLWHIITGYDTTPYGELGLQGFLLSQIRMPHSFIIIAATLIRSLVRDPELLTIGFNEFTKAWANGNQSRSLFAIDWEKELHTPVTEMRKRLGITVNEELRKAA